MITSNNDADVPCSSPPRHPELLSLVPWMRPALAAVLPRRRAAGTVFDDATPQPLGCALSGPRAAGAVTALTGAVTALTD